MKLIAASFLLVGAAIGWQTAHAQDAAVRAVPTNESVGHYRSNPGTGSVTGVPELNRGRSGVLADLDPVRKATRIPSGSSSLRKFA